MAVKKKVTKKTTRKTSAVIESEAMASELTNDTKTIIVVLLLIFVYPLGVIFMWVWMKSWPTWVKVLFTLPFILAIFAAIFGFAIAGMFVKSMMRNRYEENQMYRVRNQQYWKAQTQPGQMQNQMYLSPTPTPLSYSK